MKPRYRILWDKEYPLIPDFWKFGTKKFYYFDNIFNEVFIRTSISNIRILKQRVGLNN